MRGVRGFGDWKRGHVPIRDVPVSKVKPCPTKSETKKRGGGSAASENGRKTSTGRAPAADRGGARWVRSAGRGDAARTGRASDGRETPLSLTTRRRWRTRRTTRAPPLPRPPRPIAPRARRDLGIAVAALGRRVRSRVVDRRAERLGRATQRCAALGSSEERRQATISAIIRLQSIGS